MSIVFLCVGAAKAGTSWLYHHLSRHEDCHFRAIKELHYFDSLEGGRLERQYRYHSDQQNALLDRLSARGCRPDDAQQRRIADRADWLDVLGRGREDVPAYLTYLRSGAGQSRIVGEMTPAYALLPTSRLSKMSRMADDVRILFLMRDPIERLWSHIRMISARRDPDGKVTRKRADNIFRRVLEGKESQIADRSDYAGGVSRLRAAFDRRALLIESFEDMVHGDGLGRICDFLGIAPMRIDPLPVHRGQPLVMTEAQRSQAAAWLAPQYEAAYSAFGRMPEGWCQEGCLG